MIRKLTRDLKMSLKTFYQIIRDLQKTIQALDSKL